MPLVSVSTDCGRVSNSPVVHYTVCRRITVYSAMKTGWSTVHVSLLCDVLQSMVLPVCHSQVVRQMVKHIVNL